MTRAQLRVDTLGGHTYITELPLAKAQAASDHYARACGTHPIVGTLTLEPQDASPHITVRIAHIAGLTVQVLDQ